MNIEKPFYVKSLEEDLATQRLEGGAKKRFQSIEEMVSASGGAPHIDPNTVSFGQADRLACTVLNSTYTQTYRAQGIIFQTDDLPDYVAPFDLMVLANTPGEEIFSDYYKIVGELKEHYGRSLIPGYTNFLFKTPEEMFAKIPNPEVAWKLVNEFRLKHGLTPIPEDQKKLVMYNEVIFHKTIAIEPVALFGVEKCVLQLAERAHAINLPIFTSAQEFYLGIEEFKIKKESGVELGGAAQVLRR